MTRARVPMTRALVLWLALVAACSRDSADLARARKLVEREQWANARTALGQVLKDDPRELSARGLLLYVLEREEGVEKLTALALPVLYRFGAASLDASAKDASKQVRKYVEGKLVEARQALFDRGLDTKDVEDLLAVIVQTARYAYAHDDDPARRLFGLGVLAMAGERAAIDELIQQLKGQSPAAAADYLQDAGLPAMAPLAEALRDRGFTGRDAALQVLTCFLAGERARAMLRAQPELSSVELTPAPTLEDGLLGATRLSARRHLDLWRVHGSIARLDGERGGAEALVLLQAWNDREGRVELEAHALVDGELRRLAFVDKGDKPIVLGAEVIHQLSSLGDRVTLTRRRTRTYEVEVDAGRLLRPAPGARVRLSGLSARGELVREDQGLWLVKLDEPSHGMSELPVALDSLIALREEERSELGDEVMTARVDGDALRVSAVELRPLVGAASKP